MPFLRKIWVTLMLVTDVACQMCVDDKFEMLVTDLIHWKNHQHNEKSRQHIDLATKISNKVIEKTMSPTSLSP